MSQPVLIALIGFLGTIIGSALGVVASSKLVNYRLAQLEKKVNLHNNVIERTYKLEKQEALIEERLDMLADEIKECK